MRHRDRGRKFNRSHSHRRAMFRNMAASLFRHELICTTLPKARELRRYAEPLISLARRGDTVAGRRRAAAFLRDRVVVSKLFDELGPRYSDRPGGYLRVLRAGLRAGDRAQLASVELVDRPGYQSLRADAAQLEPEAAEVAVGDAEAQS